MPTRMYVLEGSRGANSFIRDLAHKLFRRKRLVLTLLAVWTAAMVSYVLVRPAVYEEEIRFMLRNNRAGIAVTPEMNSGPVYRDYIDETAVATELQLLSSHELLRAVVQKCHLAAGTDEESMEKAIRDLKKELKAGPVQKANMIKVRYAASDPREVASVLQAVADEFQGQHLKVHSAGGAHDLFDKQAEAAEKRLKSLQDELTAFQSKRGIVLLGAQKELNVKRTMELETALKTTQTARTENTKRIGRLNEQLAGLKPRITTQSRQVPNQYSVERLNTMLVEMQNRRTQLLTKFQPDDRLVKEVNQQIEDTKKALAAANGQIATEQTSDVNPLRQTVESELVKAEVAEAEYKARIAGLERQLGEARGVLNGLRSSSPEEDNLMRQIKEAEANFFLYSKKREDARIESAMDRERISNVYLIEPPRAPAMPLPRMSITLAAAYLLGCLLIFGLGFARSMADPLIYTAWELEGAAGAPVLAAVPLNRLAPKARLAPQPAISELNP